MKFYKINSSYLSSVVFTAKASCIYSAKASKVEQATETNNTNQHIRFKNPDWLESLNQLTIYKSSERQ